MKKEKVFCIINQEAVGLLVNLLLRILFNLQTLNEPQSLGRQTFFEMVLIFVLVRGEVKSLRKTVLGAHV